MRKLTVPFAAAGAAVLLTLAVTSMTSKAADSSYAEDRSAIEDLQARYLFAMDFGDPDLYVTTFTEDGILSMATRPWAAPTGSITATTIRNGARCSTATVIMRTSS